MRAGDLKRGILLTVVIVVSVSTVGCSGEVEFPSGGRSEHPAIQVPGADAGRGAQAIAHHGCGACHRIPGIGEATGLVGPPLTSFSRRSYIAGEVPNSVPNLVRWIKDPQSIEPTTAMPNLGVTEQMARDMAAYLYTLD